jgi:hypothetical protein
MDAQLLYDEQQEVAGPCWVQLVENDVEDHDLVFAPDKKLRGESLHRFDYDRDPGVV